MQRLGYFLSSEMSSATCQRLEGSSAKRNWGCGGWNDANHRELWEDQACIDRWIAVHIDGPDRTLDEIGRAIGYYWYRSVTNSLAQILFGELQITVRDVAHGHETKTCFFDCIRVEKSSLPAPSKVLGKTIVHFSGDSDAFTFNIRYGRAFLRLDWQLVSTVTIFATNNACINSVILIALQNTFRSLVNYFMPIEYFTGMHFAVPYSFLLFIERT